jgi:hypothetical protein
MGAIWIWENEELKNFWALTLGKENDDDADG